MLLDQAIHRWTTCVVVRSTEACQLTSADGWLLAGLLVDVLAVAYTGRKLIRTLLTLPALALMPALSRQLSNWVKARDYAEEEFCELMERESPGWKCAERRSTVWRLFFRPSMPNL
jgi:hypothetical protein